MSAICAPHKELESTGRYFQMGKARIGYGIEQNMMSVQSDCPHRERFGYGGDPLGCGEAGLSICASLIPLREDISIWLSLTNCAI